MKLRKRNLSLILDFKKLSIEELSYIKIQIPCVYRDDIPPLEKWFPINFNKLTNNDLMIIKIDFPVLYIKILKKYKQYKKLKKIN